jgi:hypothetical protein
MKIEKKFDFMVSADAVLTLENLFAGVEVKAGSKKSVSVILNGMEKFLNKVNVTQNLNNILVSGGTLNEELLAAKSVRCKKTLSITIFVPIGTKVIVSMVQETQICGVKGKIEADIINQSYLSAMGTLDLNLKCSDYSHCNMTNVMGNVKVNLIDHANVSLSGRYESVDIRAIDHGVMTLVGSCYELKTSAFGSGRIHLNSKVKGRLN